MNYIYILRSLRNKRRYVGRTTRDPQLRLREHNSEGAVQWTRRNGPFMLVHAQECGNKKEALELEKFLKSGQGRQCLDELGI